MRIETIPLYNDRDYVTLMAFLWSDSGEMLAGKKRPALLICPGGAYLTCSDREAEPVAMKFASMGYDAFVLRYSTYCEGGTRFPDLSKPLKVKKHVQYPTAMREIGMAMLLIHEHADEWMVDADKITICGFSAGGHNVVMYGTHWNQPVIQDYFENRGTDLRPAAMILGYTMSDFIYMKEDNIARRVALFEGTNKGLLGVENPDDETRVAMSPALLVNADTPPTFLWGTSSAAHQIEGAYKEDGKGPNIWDVFEKDRAEKLSLFYQLGESLPRGNWAGKRSWSTVLFESGG